MTRRTLGVIGFTLAALLVGGAGALPPAATQEEHEQAAAETAAPEDTPETTSEAPVAEPEHPSTELDADNSEAGPDTEVGAGSPEHDWVGRAEELSRSILLGEADREDAEALLSEVEAALEAARQRLRASLESRTPSERQAAEHEEMEDLYESRLLLMKEIRAVLRVQRTGLAATGVREARKELDRLHLHLRHQLSQVPTKSRTILEDFQTSPVPLIKDLFYLLLVVLIFRIWRRWAAETLPRIRRDLLAVRPRTRRNVRAAKVFWYVDRLRSPLEWLAVLAMIAAVLRPTTPLQDEQPLWIIIKWIILAWFGLRLVDALAERGGTGLARGTSGLRLRSLRLVCGWAAAMGLGRDLAREYAGEGTLFSWVGRVTLVLGVPVLLVLLHWWREEIFRGLQKESHQPAFIQRMSAGRGARRGYMSAALGAVFLMQRGLQRWFLRLVSSTEVGKRAVAQILRRQVARQAEDQARKDESLLSESAREKIINGPGLVEKVHRQDLRSLEGLAGRERGRTAAIVGERGAGKSTLLDRLSGSLGDRILVLDCPIGGFDALLGDLRRGLSLPNRGEVAVTVLVQALEHRGVQVVAVDNAHRLARPAIGGLAELERLAALIRELGPDVSWIVTLDRAAWQYISRARAEATFLDLVIQLRGWTETELDELIAKRSAVAGIQPDFDHLVLPRQLDEVDYEVMADRKRFGFLRILWDASDGNPGVALRLWCDALRVSDQGTIVVRLFRHGETADLEDLSPTARFVLRSMVQMEFVDLGDLVEALRLRSTDVEAAVRHFLVRGYVEEQDGRYHVTWQWYRSITRMLARQNLLITS